MERFARTAQVAVVVAWAVGLTLGGLFVGMSRDGLVTEITNHALASPEARNEVSEHIAHARTR